MYHMDDREVKVVKGIIVLALILLTGCAGFTPLEQLEAQALVSGDWSAVERRERIIARRNWYSNLRCPEGTIGYCEIHLSPSRCSCVDAKVIRSLFSDRY
jgi:hypothetical protein